MTIARPLVSRDADSGTEPVGSRAGGGGSRHAPEARIGPNAVTRTLDAVQGARGAPFARALADASGLPERLPGGMVPEALFRRLLVTLHDRLGEERALGLLEEAGEATGRYVLQHRIPRIARLLLRLLPARLALPLLLRACARHSWTFAGRGRFTWGSASGGAWIELEESPTCRDRRQSRPAGTFYRGAFVVLSTALVHRDTTVEEVECAACGAPRCRFTLTLPRAGRSAAEPESAPVPSLDPAPRALTNSDHRR